MDMPVKTKGIQWVIFALIAIAAVGVILIASQASARQAAPIRFYQGTGAPVMGGTLQTVTRAAVRQVRATETALPPTPTLRLATATASQTEPPPFLSPTPDNEGNIYHLVASADTLGIISSLYGVSEAELRTNNWMHGNAILAGQRLMIVKGQDWKPQYAGYAIQKGEMLSAYPASLEMPRFTLHYIPQTYPAVDPEALARLFENGLNNDEKLFGHPLLTHFDLFATGVFYAIPDQYLRGHSYSKDLYIAFLHDGSGDAIDQQYLMAHEMTHLYMWNTFGQPFSFLLSEGAAVYAGKSLTASSSYIQLEQFCKAYEILGKLPRISDKELTYKGQNYDLENYYTAGCFVKYLIERYGVDELGGVYGTDDYEGVYGKSLVELENEWHTYLHNLNLSFSFNPQELVDVNEALKSSYQRFFADIFTRPNMLNYYLLLDQARLAGLDLRFVDAKELLRQYQSALP